MLDFLAYIESHSWYDVAWVLGLMLLVYLLWREAKARGKEYIATVKRIEILEQSVKEKDRVICRSECIDLLRQISDDLRKFL